MITVVFDFQGESFQLGKVTQVEDLRRSVESNEKLLQIGKSTNYAIELARALEEAQGQLLNVLDLFRLEGVSVKEIHVRIDLHPSELRRVGQERLDDLVSRSPFVDLKIELDEAQDIILELLERLRQLHCFELVPHGDLEVHLRHVACEKMAFSYKFGAHLVFGQNVDCIQKEMVPLTKVLNLDRQIPVQKANDVLEALEIYLVGALGDLDEIIDFVVVPRDLGYVARIQVIIGVGYNDL